MTVIRFHCLSMCSLSKWTRKRASPLPTQYRVKLHHKLQVQWPQKCSKEDSLHCWIKSGIQIFQFFPHSEQRPFVCEQGIPLTFAHVLSRLLGYMLDYGPILSILLAFDIGEMGNSGSAENLFWVNMVYIRGAAIVTSMCKGNERMHSALSCTKFLFKTSFPTA